MITGIHPNEIFNSMSEFRSAYPQPLLAKMISRWNLDEEHRAMLDRYKLADAVAWKLNNELNNNKGSLILDGINYTPIYQQCSRDHIKDNAKYSQGFMYWLSFRKTGEFAVVLIQPKRNQK